MVVAEEALGMLLSLLDCASAAVLKVSEPTVGLGVPILLSSGFESALRACSAQTGSVRSGSQEVGLFSKNVAGLEFFADHIFKKSNKTTQQRTPPPPPLWKCNGLILCIFFILSVNLAPCPGGAPHDPHQSHIPFGGEWSGSDGAAELAVLGRDGQFIAQHRPAAEDSH